MGEKELYVVDQSIMSISDWSQYICKSIGILLSPYTIYFFYQLEL